MDLPQKRKVAEQSFPTNKRAAPSPRPQDGVLEQDQTRQQRVHPSNGQLQQNARNINTLPVSDIVRDEKDSPPVRRSTSSRPVQRMWAELATSRNAPMLPSQSFNNSPGPDPPTPISQYQSPNTLASYTLPIPENNVQISMVDIRFAKILTDTGLGEGPAIFANIENGFSKLPDAETAACLAEKYGTENVSSVLKGHILERHLAGETEEEYDAVVKYRLVYDLLQQSVPKPNAQPNRASVRSQPPIADFNNLAISKIRTVIDSGDCHFCNSNFGADFGVYDESLYLPQSAAAGFCGDCHHSVSEGSTWLYTTQKHYEKVYVTPEQIFHSAASSLKGALPESQPLPSKLVRDGRKFVDIGNFMHPMFCRGCPWSQIDVNLARICGPCKAKKVSILRHCHQRMAVINEHPDLAILGLGRCMICINQGAYICAECPLRLCTTCKVLLDTQCKGSVTKLLYQYGRRHIRNDAFLLRNDGGGY